MIFKYHGHAVSQAQILREAYGGKVPSSPWQKPNTLSRAWTDEAGRRFTVAAEKMPVSATDAAEELAENQPLIIGAFGHPVVLTSISYTGDRLGGLTLVEAKVRDPWPGKDVRAISSPEWINVHFIARVSVEKAVARAG